MWPFVRFKPGWAMPSGVGWPLRKAAMSASMIAFPLTTTAIFEPLTVTSSEFHSPAGCKQSRLAGITP